MLHLAAFSSRQAYGGVMKELKNGEQECKYNSSRENIIRVIKLPWKSRLIGAHDHMTTRYCLADINVRQTVQLLCLIQTKTSSTVIMADKEATGE